MRITYWVCDRCEKKLRKYSDIALITLIKKSQELCPECTKDYKVWLKKGRKLKKELRK